MPSAAACGGRPQTLLHSRPLCTHTTSWTLSVQVCRCCRRLQECGAVAPWCLQAHTHCKTASISRSVTLRVAYEVVIPAWSRHACPLGRNPEGFSIHDRPAFPRVLPELQRCPLACCQMKNVLLPCLSWLSSPHTLS